MKQTHEKPTTFAMTQAHWDHLQKSGDRHKHCYGHAVIVAGPFGHGGAARLAARGALRIGAGLVSVACAADAVQEHAAHLNAIMIKPFGAGRSLPACFTQIRPSAICIGPNLGLDAAAKRALVDTLAQTCPICIDADAITLLSDATGGIDPAAQRQNVMSPHEGELRRFIPAAFEQTTCRVTLATLAAAKANCVVLFKGVDTIIAAPTGEFATVSSRPFQHAGWLATAGSGDVLSGFITGLLARGLGAFEAASVAAHLHLLCAEAFGPGLIAEDIPEMVPRVLRLKNEGLLDPLETGPF